MLYSYKSPWKTVTLKKSLTDFSMKVTQQYAHPILSKVVNIKAIKTLKHGRRAESLVMYGAEGISNALMRPMYKPKFDVFNLFHVNYLSSNLQVLKCSESGPTITSNSPGSHTYSSSEL